MSTINYDFNREFPMPFQTSLTHVTCSNGSMLMNWMDFGLDETFQNDVIRKMNGEDIDLNGFFFIWHGTNKPFPNDKDLLLGRNASSESSFIYFWKNDEKQPKLLLKMRGWGHLTGKGGGLGLDADVAVKIQDSVLNFIRDILNADMNTTELIIAHQYVEPEKPVEKPVDENCKFIDASETEPVNFVNGPIQLSDNIIGDPMQCLAESACMTETSDVTLKKAIRASQKPWYLPCLKIHRKKRNK